MFVQQSRPPFRTALNFACGINGRIVGKPALAVSSSFEQMRRRERPRAARDATVALLTLAIGCRTGRASNLVPGAPVGCAEASHLICAFLRNVEWKDGQCCVQGERVGSTMHCVPGSHLACNHLGRATFTGINVCASRRLCALNDARRDRLPVAVSRHAPQDQRLSRLCGSAWARALFRGSLWRG